MPQVLTGLLSGDALKPVYAAKSRQFDEKTVSAASKEALDLKVGGEEADGWRVIRSNKRSVRLAKDKPVDRQLEDDVWSLLYRMGFKELNFDRNFAIQVGANTSPRRSSRLPCRNRCGLPKEHIRDPDRRVHHGYAQFLCPGSWTLRHLQRVFRVAVRLIGSKRLTNCT
jgi:hypothetical protein